MLAYWYMQVLNMTNAPIVYMVIVRIFCDVDILVTDFIKMSDGAAGDGGASYVSVLDLFVIGGAIGFCTYWFLFRKTKKPEPAEFKRLQPT